MEGVIFARQTTIGAECDISWNQISMTQGHKRLGAMRANPRKGWTIGDIESVCRSFDIDCNTPTGGGSHYKVAHRSQFEILTIPARRPIKPVYIRQFVDFVDAVIGAGNGHS